MAKEIIKNFFSRKFIVLVIAVVFTALDKMGEEYLFYTFVVYTGFNVAESLGTMFVKKSPIVEPTTPVANVEE